MPQWWSDIGKTLVAEFSDISDLSDITLICVRLLLAAILGGVLGYEREQQGKAAGIRTHMLVAMGATLFVLAPLQAGAEADAMSRVIQGIVAGIGFLGAGTILKGNGDNDEAQVKGLTTAAGLWLTAAIGVAVGLGHAATAVLSTLLALIIFAVMPRIAQALIKTKP